MENGDTMLSLVADIVTAHVSKNEIPVGEVSALIGGVHKALLDILHPAATESESTQAPAVSIKSSVKPDFIVCLECGVAQKTLKRHLASAHNISPEEYRKKWNLLRDYPMVAPSYSAQRKELALKMGLGKKPVPKKGRPRKKRSVAR